MEAIATTDGSPKAKVVAPAAPVAHLRIAFDGWRRCLPGVALLALGAAVALAGGMIVPGLSPVVWAVLIGAGLGFVPWPERIAAGMDTYPSWVKVGVVLTGAGVSYASLWAVGSAGALLLAAKLAGGFLIAEGWGRLLGQGRVARRLMGLGTSVCGISAIVTAAPLIGTPEEAAGPAGAVILWGASCLMLLPGAGHLLAIAPVVFGAMAGLGVDNTAESLATGFAYGPQAGAVATALKLTRNSLLGVAVAATGVRRAAGDLPSLLRQTFPLFIVGFLALALLNTLSLIPPPVAHGLVESGDVAFLFAFTGLGVAFRRMSGGRLGREVVYGLVVEASGFALVTGLALWLFA